MAEDKKEVPPQVQANNNSTAVGSIAVGGELSGNINIGGEMHVHYHASQDAPKSTVFEDTISKQDFEPYTILVPEGPVILPASETEGVLLHENPQQEFVMKVYRIGKLSARVRTSNMRNLSKKPIGLFLRLWVGMVKRCGTASKISLYWGSHGTTPWIIANGLGA